MKVRTGYVYQDKKTDVWYARFTYTDNSSKRRDIKRRVESKSDGNELLKKLISTFDNGGRPAIDADKLTFNDLADYYAEHYMKPAQYVNGRKIAGLRSVVSVRGYVKVFREHFGRKKLKTITYEDLLTFRHARLNTSTQQSEQRSLTTVNREMAYLRRLLNIAERAGMIAKNPFRMGDPLIHVADEVKRERILTREEETRLLAACVGHRAHLRPIIIFLLDTGCRLGEALKLKWRDIDEAEGMIIIRAFNTKTMRERQVSVTARLTIELEKLRERSKVNPDALVFGISSGIRQGFRNTCEEAGLQGLRAHDLRHTHATRLDDLGFSLAKIGGQLGHTVVQTTLRYVNRDKAAVRQVAAALDGFNAEAVGNLEPSEMVN